MTRSIRPIHPLRLPGTVSILQGEAEDCAESPIAPGLDPTRCFPGVKAWAVVPQPYVARPSETHLGLWRVWHASLMAVSSHVTREQAEAEAEALNASIEPMAYALFVPEEYVSGEGDGHMGGLMTQRVGRDVVDVRDVLDSEPLTIARAIRRALQEARI